MGSLVEVDLSHNFLNGTVPRSFMHAWTERGDGTYWEEFTSSVPVLA